MPAPSLRDNCRISPEHANIGRRSGLDLAAPVRTPGGEPNCLNIFNGNKVDSATDGLVIGGALDGGFTDGCESHGRRMRSAEAIATNWRSSTVSKSTTTSLSCFISGGNERDSFINYGRQLGHTKSLDRLFSSPRFFFVPVLNFTVNPPNGYYPIVRFVGAFITDEYNGPRA